MQMKLKTFECNALCDIAAMVYKNNNNNTNKNNKNKKIFLMRLLVLFF